MANLLVVTGDPDVVSAARNAADALDLALMHVRSAAEALTLAVRGAADLVLIDAELPLMDAIALAYALDDPEAGVAVPTIALARPGQDWRNMLDAGVTAVVARPVAASSLRHAIRRALPEEPRGRGARMRWIIFFPDATMAT
jgi:DNA-binding response OmpR family regulator